MIKKWKKELGLSLFLALIGFFVVLLFPLISQAYSTTGDQISKLQTTVDIQENGLTVIEHNFKASTSSNLFFWIIPNKEADQIEIREDGEIIFPREVRREGNRIVVFFQPSSADFFSDQKITVSYNLPANIELSSDRQQVQVILLREAGVEIDQASVEVNYPVIEGVKQRYYAIHGVEKAELVSEDGNQFRYSAKGISPYGILSLNLSFPAGTFSLSSSQTIQNWLANLSLETVTLISIVIPLFVFFVLFSLYRGHIYTKKSKDVKGVADAPPSQMNPPIVEMLVKGKVGKNGIGALIYSLIIKGYLTIIDKGESIDIGKIKDPGQDLSELESLMIKILFRRSKFKGGFVVLKKQKGKIIFDQLVDNFYSRISYLINRDKLFIGDSKKTSGKVLRQSAIFFFIFLVTTVFLLFYIPSSPWLGLAPISLLIASLLVVRMRAAFSIRSNKGQEELVEWLKFKNYIVAPHPIQGADQKKFEKYLPWAFLFDGTDQWLNKFGRYPMTKPDWFATSEHGLTTKDWLAKTDLLINELAEEISELKSPNGV